MASPTPDPGRRWLIAALAVHLVLGGIYLVILPLWGAVPDEPLHYSRIKYEAEFLQLPRITDPRPWGEPLAVYCFTADPCGTAQHGPLYYTLAVPLFHLTRGLSVEQQLYALRGWSLLLGTLGLLPAWWILRRLFADSPTLAGLGLLAVALVPHRLMLSGVVYNDIGAVAVAAFCLWALLRAAGDDGTPRHWLTAGLLFGLLFLTKRIALVTVPGTLVALALQARRLHWPWPRTLAAFGAWAAGGALVGGWWLARDLLLYGEPFPTEPGITQLNWLEVWYGLPPERFGWMIRYALRGFWLSLWSQVGWVPMGSAAAWGLYGGLGLATLATAAGFVGGWRSRWRGLSPATRDMLAAYAFMFLGMVYGGLHWVMLASFHNNEETGKHAQAIFVCLAALALAAARWWLGARRAVWGAAAGVALLAAFNLVSLVHLTTRLIPEHRPATPVLARERVRDLPSGVAPGMWHRYRVPGVQQRGGEVSRPSRPEEAWRG